MCSSWGAQNIIKNPLGFETKDDSNIFELKNRGDFFVKNQSILQKLVFMATFEEISKWVETNSQNQKFIANPTSASDTDRLSCLFAVQEPLVRALKPIEKRRKNGRDGRLIKAAEADNYTVIADILASVAWSYWLDHGFLLDAKSRININAASQFQNYEINIEKKELQKAQIERIGAVLGFEKAGKKGALQEVLDFEETMLVIGEVE